MTTRSERPVTVLLVDDDGDIRAVYATALRRAGYRVIVAVNGLDALHHVPRDRPDVILMDLVMPQLDGARALDVIRGDAATRAVPVIAVTALGPDGMGSAVRADFDEVLFKPVSLARLLAAVQDAVEKARA